MTDRRLSPNRAIDSTPAVCPGDLALARRAAARDERAWRDIETMARDLLAGVVWRFGLGDARDDLLQDVMLRLVLKIDTYRGESPLRVWVASVVYNRLRNAYRARMTEGQIFGVPRPGLEAIGGALADATSVRTSERALAMVAMAGLREDHWNIVLLRFFAELRVDEAARRLGVAEGTVKSRLNRAVLELRLFVLVLRGAALAEAAAASGIALAAARDKVRAALPAWRRLLPAALVTAVEWRLLGGAATAARAAG